MYKIFFSNAFHIIRVLISDRRKTRSESPATIASPGMRLTQALIARQKALNKSSSLNGVEQSASESGSRRSSEPLENGKSNGKVLPPYLQYTPLYTPSTRKRRHTTQHTTFTPRKITRFSITPSPYHPNRNVNIDEAIRGEPSPEPELKNSAESVQAEEKPEKISMTATAMLSLIDEPEVSEVKVVSSDSKPSKKFVNPYASIASKSTPRHTPPKLIRKTTATPSSVIKSLERTMPSNDKKSTKIAISNPALEKFKPVQSSSLRQSILPDTISKTTAEDAKRHDTASTAIIEQPKPTYTWSVPEIFYDEMDLDEDVPTKEKEVSAPSLTFNPPTSTPAESKPFVFKNDTAIPETKPSSLFGSTSKPEKKLAHATPTPVVNGNTTFMFGSPASNSGDSSNSLPKPSTLATTGTENPSTSVPPAAVTQPVATLLHPKVEPVKEASINIPQFNLSTPAPLFGSKPNTIASINSTSVDSSTASSLFASKPAPAPVFTAVASNTTSLPTANETLKNLDAEKIKKYSSLFELPTTKDTSSAPVGSEKKIQELKTLFKF